MKDLLEKEQNKVKKFIEKNEIISELFGENWLEDNILNYPDLCSIHPLYRKIRTASERPESGLLSKLEALRNKHKKWKSFVKHLKEDRANFYSHFSNLDVFHELGKKIKNVELEPHIPGDLKHADIKVNLNGTDYWGEICTIYPPKEEAEFGDLLERIKIKYYQQNDTENCFSINFISENYRDISEEAFLDFLLKNARITKLQEKDTRKVNYYQNRELFAEIEYSKTHRFSKGFFKDAAEFFPWQKLEPSRRIKEKILNKFDKFQWPRDLKTKRFLYLYIRDDRVETIDADNALFGQEILKTFPLDSSHKLYRGRDKNGVIHEKRNFNLIDFVVYFFWGRNNSEIKFIKQCDDQELIRWAFADA